LPAFLIRSAVRVPPADQFSKTMLPASGATAA
jgi:hypothetical protein